jgi:hypothetical protein
MLTGLTMPSACFFTITACGSVAFANPINKGMNATTG